MTQTFINTPDDCQWLRETHLADRNLNNANPLPAFKSACIFGNEDCPQQIMVYRDQHPNVTDTPASAFLCDNGRYSFFAPQPLTTANT